MVGPSSQDCGSSTLTIMSTLGTKRGDGELRWVDRSEPRASDLGLSEH